VEVYVAPCGKLGDAFKVEKIYIPNQYLDEYKNKNPLLDYALVKLANKTNLDDFIPLSLDFFGQIKKE